MTGFPRAMAVLSVALLLVGCASGVSRKKPEELAPQYKFEDVPVHPKLTMDAGESFIFETRSLKAGILVYHGSQSIAEVVTFFKDEMPKHAWRMVNSIEGRGASVLNFEKPGWSTLIRITRTALVTDVEITIGPRGEAAEPPAPSPPQRRR